MTTRPLARLTGLLFLLTLCLSSLGVHAAGETEVYEYFYDANGNLTRTLDPLMKETVQRFDALDRPFEAIDALGAKTRFVRDSLDRLIRVTDPVDAMTEFRFDGLDNPTQVNSADTGSVIRKFDAAGNLFEATDARGATLHYRYDALNRLTAIEGAATEAIRFSYDQGPNGLGRLTGMIDEAGKTTWQYDARGRTTSRTSLWAEATLTLHYTYDGNGYPFTVLRRLMKFQVS